MDTEKLGNMVLHVNLLAMRAMLVKMMAEIFEQSGDANMKASDWMRFFEKVADQLSFPGETPEWSDLASQEFREVVMITLHQARAQALKEPYDPEAHHLRTL